MIDCVNMETKTCFFDHGGIDVGVSMQTIHFRGIRPPIGAGTLIREEDGTKVGDWEHTGSMLSVLFNTMDEAETVCDLLKKVEDNQSGSFEFKGVVFDFTVYKQASMEIVKNAMKFVKKNIIYLMAC